ncbi:gliding motility-associated ABC transporter substrate-binding protein GldG [Gelidibacter salicanalis]|uniref:Gliding motility-associated ABC transporter substrate-binding protein GldG n=1 Tax=Gelidibacter salicanalis TaxID=291193 RepID=A0A934NKK7_9FLAO|nr:gliding motility-associated ABC transporter substrate-binding protein GldG [Gelidibacter salicanalis]MBJ7881102.1 gliding motility-associated ABC transporter substrate-binding protein GldG [Gelidibacter salicanalis]
MLKNKSILIKIMMLFVALLALNWGGTMVYKRFDLTQNKRYTLSQSALATVKHVKSPLIVDVFLEGNFPSEFRRLRNETEQLLEEFALDNDQIIVNFINPQEDQKLRDNNIEQLVQRGLEPLQLSVNNNGKTSQELIFPWALASYNDQTVKIPLIKNKIGASQQELVTNSIQHLEYAFAEGFQKLVTPKSKKIAILKGNGQLGDAYVADFLQAIKEHYFLAPFTLDSVATNAEGTLNKLNTFDLVISAKPTQAFSEAEKLVLDQYTMNGGKSLWLTESILMDKDSLYNDEGRGIAMRNELNLNDFFFSYGVRINPVIVNDMFSAPITLAMGEGSNAQFQPIKWPYSPLAAGNPEHPITSNLNLVKFDFASQLDTLKSSTKKTILLQSSKLTKLEGVPKEISLAIVTQDQDPATFTQGPQTLAVLMEGEFTSAYKNRIKPFTMASYKDSSPNTKMIVIADGDVIKNDVIKNKPQELGFDRWTGQNFGNKEFLTNAVNYLLNDDGLLNVRTKDINIAFLDAEATAENKTLWQVLTIALPLLLLAIFGVVFTYIRRKKYA